MTILTAIAEIIGFIVLGLIALPGLVAVVVVSHDLIRARFPRYDMWFYDENRRWNRRKRNQRAA